MGWIYLIVALSFVFGMTSLPRWSVLLWPFICIALGLASVGMEPANYDMQGYGLFLGGVAAFACVGGWLMGRALRGRMTR